MLHPRPGWPHWRLVVPCRGYQTISVFLAVSRDGCRDLVLGQSTFGRCLTVRKHFLESRTFLASGTIHAPECHAGLGQDVSSADEIGIALVIAGDTSKHLSHAVAPIVLTTSGTCSGGASRIDSNGTNTVFPCQRFDPLSHPPIGPRGGGYAEVLASALGFASFQSVQVFEADGREPMPRQLLDGVVDGVVAGPTFCA